jgi:hypothetical protein
MKTKEPVLAKEPEEIPPPYVLLYPPLPPVPSSTPSPSTLDGEARGTVTPVKSGLEASGASTALTSLSPVDPMSTPTLLVLTPHPALDQEHLASLLRLPLPCRCP